MEFNKNVTVPSDLSERCLLQVVDQPWVLCDVVGCPGVQYPSGASLLLCDIRLELG
jgi:hypothetical protein